MTFPKVQGPYKNIGQYDHYSGTGIKSSILFRIYYPLLNHQESLQDIDWMPQTEFDRFADSMGSNFEKMLIKTFLKNTKLKNVKTQTTDEITPMNMKMKLAIFCHGLSANRYLYSFICKNLASHGYIVFAPDFKDTSSTLSFYIDENNVRHEIKHVPNLPIVNGGYYTESNRQVYEFNRNRLLFRMQEMIQLFDVIEALNSLKIPQIENKLDNKLCKAFSNLIDYSKPLLLGHSFGACTILKYFIDYKPDSKLILLDLWSLPLSISDYCSIKDNPDLFRCSKVDENNNKIYTNSRILLLNSEIFHGSALITRYFGSNLVNFSTFHNLKQCNMFSFPDSSHFIFCDLAFIIEPKEYNIFLRPFIKKFTDKVFGSMDKKLFSDKLFKAIDDWIEFNCILNASDFRVGFLDPRNLSTNIKSIKANVEQMFGNPDKNAYYY